MIALPAGVATDWGTAAAAAVPSHDEMLARVDALIPHLWERAEETERIRRIPESTMGDLKDAGVFRALSPKSVGGYGMGVETYAEVVRRLARGCPSTAWTAGHLIEHVWMLARWPREVQNEVFASGPAPLAAATGAPVGLADKVAGGYRISGRWTFASGVMHSQWALLAVEHRDVRLQCLVAVSDVELLDVWHTAGLRGTGSNDIQAVELFVPEYRTIDWAILSAADNPGSRIHQDPIVHTPMATLLNMVAPAAALGAAEHAVELFREGVLVRKVKTPWRAAKRILRSPRPGSRKHTDLLPRHGCSGKKQSGWNAGGGARQVPARPRFQWRGVGGRGSSHHGRIGRKRPPAVASTSADPARRRCTAQPSNIGDGPDSRTGGPRSLGPRRHYSRVLRATSAESRRG